MLLVTAFTIIAFSSCKKDSTDDLLSTSTISADVDGTATVYTTNALAVKGELNGAEFTSIQGTDKDGNTISMSVYGTLKAGKTYVSTSSEFEDKPTISFSNANGDDIYFNDEASIQTITVTAASANKVEGTFSGKVSTGALGNGAVKTKTFTNGKFKVAIISK
ncbi:hypothetical protein GCM10007352_33490 [Mucilaginibacter phyllosphaerae]|nr:hypothetical protein GCM10007352_33490 [Mucilaginibacter phyllosphaerae]